MRPLTPLRFAKITRINLEIWSSLLLSIINNFNRNLIITSSFVTSINNFNLARVAIESWKKKKKKQRDIIFFHFSYPRRTSSFFFFSPPFFRVFSTHSLFSYFLQIERNSTIPTDIRVCDRFFPRAFLLFFHCRVPLWIAAPPIYIYIYSTKIIRSLRAKNSGEKYTTIDRIRWKKIRGGEVVYTSRDGRWDNERVFIFSTPLFYSMETSIYISLAIV